MHHRAIQIQIDGYLPVWVSNERSRLTQSQHHHIWDQNGNCGQIRTLASKGLTSRQPTTTFIWLSSQVLLRQPTYIWKSFLIPVPPFWALWTVFFVLSWNGEKAHPQLSMLLLQFTSIWAPLWRRETKMGIILSSGIAVSHPYGVLLRNQMKSCM